MNNKPDEDEQKQTEATIAQIDENDIRTEDNIDTLDVHAQLMTAVLVATTPRGRRVQRRTQQRNDAERNLRELEENHRSNKHNLELAGDARG